MLLCELVQTKEDIQHAGITSAEQKLEGVQYIEI